MSLAFLLVLNNGIGQKKSLAEVLLLDFGLKLALLLGGWEALSAMTSLWGPDGRARLFLLSLGNGWYLLM